MKVRNVGAGEVVLVASPKKCYTDIAARFVGSERGIESILASPTDKQIIRNILASGHNACTEFDYYLFAIEGFSRVTEVQLVRKRLASYMIKSGRTELGGKREFSVVLPEGLEDISGTIKISPEQIRFGSNTLYDILDGNTADKLLTDLIVTLSTYDLLSIIDNWYSAGLVKGVKEEDLRYMKPQCTVFKALIGMNAHSLLDWFKVRCCKNAQSEIRDLALKMLSLCQEDNAVLFENAGASCKGLGYCPENSRQNIQCKGRVKTHKEVLEILKEFSKGS